MTTVRRSAWIVVVLSSLACFAWAEDQPRYITDRLGRIESVTSSEGTTAYAYYASGQIREVRHADGTYENFRREPKAGAGLANPLAHPRAVASAKGSAAFLPSANRFGFAGLLWDSEIGLYYANSRYYDPALGRFTGQDILVGKAEDPPSLNRYQYARSNPTRFVDRSGREAGLPDDTYFHEQWLNSLAPQQQVAQRAIETQAQSDTAAMTLGGIYSLGNTVVQAYMALGHLAYAGTLGNAFGNNWSGEATKRNLDALEAFVQHPWDVAVQSHRGGLREARRRFEGGDAFGAGEALFGPLAADYLGVRATALLARSAAQRLRAPAEPAAPSLPETPTLGEGLSSARPMIVQEGGGTEPSELVPAFGAKPPASPLEPGPGGRVYVADALQGANGDLVHGGGAGRQVGRWSPKEVAGRIVYQARDIFNPAKESSWQDASSGQWKRGSNVERMADGLAPIGKDGKPVNLHHLLQQEPGPLAEVPSSSHSRLPHKLKGSGESFRNDPTLRRQFEEYRGEYWKQRSQDFPPR